MAAVNKIPLWPEYSFTLGIEENFDVEAAIKWLRENQHLPFIMGFGVYLPVLYALTLFMANREPYKLRGPLILWNFGLAAFSIVGFLRVAPEFFHTYRNFGFMYTACNNSYLQSKPTRFWVYMFVLSKMPELVDTVFLVLKKQKLIFLHVYHHASVVVFAWFILADRVAGARWFCTMNLCVHSIMYTYYALKAVPNFVRIPKWVSMLITSSQTLQMVAGASVVATAFIAHLSGQKCDTTTFDSLLGLGIYVSYLVLFSHFFYKAYLAPSGAKARESGKKKV